MKLPLATLLALVPAFAAGAPWLHDVTDPLSSRAMYEQLAAAPSMKRSGEDFSSAKYTHIVLGGGTAGTALAVRLSDDPAKRVGLLEAGPIALTRPDTNTPGLFGANLATELNYNYTTQADIAPAVPWPRGKVLGGSSALNFLVWDRASKAEYDAWEELGSKGWNWANLYKYMRKSEKFTAPSAADQASLNIETDSADYGSAGAVQVSYPRYISEQVKRWIPALEELKIQHNNNPLAGDNKGASVQPSNILATNSTRSFSATAYFAPASSRPNLSVLPGATVQRIVFSSGNSTKNKVVATGVEYTHSGQKFTATLVNGGEVIVSGGTVNTPQILELSGIGQKAALQKAGIKQIIDLPGVGENVQDHVYTAAVWKLKNGSVTLDSLRNDPSFAAKQQSLYAANKVSILQETVPAIAYLTLPQLVGKAKALKLVAQAASYVASAKVPFKASLYKQLEHLTKRLDTVSQMEVIGIDGFFAPGTPQAGVNYITFLAAQQHSLSRGSIHVQSSDAAKAPLIDANYFTANWDLDVLTAGTSYLRSVANTKIYKASGFVEDEVLPGKNVDLSKYSKENVVTEYHPIGSASLGPKAQGGVVDASLKVYGTANVRVADASVIPVHVSAHIQATVYGIAEAAAAIIHNKWTYLQ